MAGVDVVPPGAQDANTEREPRERVYSEGGGTLSAKVLEALNTKARATVQSEVRTASTHPAVPQEPTRVHESNGSVQRTSATGEVHGDMGRYSSIQRTSATQLRHTPRQSARRAAGGEDHGTNHTQISHYPLVGHPREPIKPWELPQVSMIHSVFLFNCRIV